MNVREKRSDHIGIRVEPSLKRQIESMAILEERSLSRQVYTLLRIGLRTQRTEKLPDDLLSTSRGVRQRRLLGTRPH